MKRHIRIKAGSVAVLAVLNNTRTADGIWDALPFHGEVRAWGAEIYFEIPLKMELQKGQDVVEAGDMGYWPQGNAFCIFFGTTPASRGDEIRAASPVDVFGELLSEPDELLEVRDGDSITVEQVIR